MIPRPCLFLCPSRDPRALPIYSNVSVGILTAINSRRRRGLGTSGVSGNPIVLATYVIRAAQMDALNALIPEGRKP